MLDNLTNRFYTVFRNIRGQARLDEENIKPALREVRLALLEADVVIIAFGFSATLPGWLASQGVEATGSGRIVTGYKAEQPSHFKNAPDVLRYCQYRTRAA